MLLHNSLEFWNCYNEFIWLTLQKIGAGIKKYCLGWLEMSAKRNEGEGALGVYRRIVSVGNLILVCMFTICCSNRLQIIFYPSQVLTKHIRGVSKKSGPKKWEGGGTSKNRHKYRWGNRKVLFRMFGYERGY